MQDIIKELKQKNKKLKKAIKFLDGCKDFDYGDFKKAWRMTGSTAAESELQSMWENSKLVLPGPGHAGGTDSLRDVTRESLVNAINESNVLMEKLKAIG